MVPTSGFAAAKWKALTATLTLCLPSGEIPLTHVLPGEIGPSE